jgi:cAMP phosphodiesterase
MQTLTSFIVNDCIAVDAGSLGFALTPKQMSGLRDIVITHVHSDHTASLPVFVAEAFVGLEEPITIHATGEVVAALRQFVFNDQIWPDFERIALTNGTGPALRFRSLTAGEAVQIRDISITPIPVNHVVPTSGLILRDGGSAIALTSDTYTTDEIWRAAAETPDLRAVFVDVSFPAELEDLAAASKHFTPRSLAVDLKKLGRTDVEIYAVHIKPSNRETVIDQLARLTDPAVRVAEIGRVYEW